MSKELEIRRQFLDEAQEYLNSLDAAVMGLSGGRVDVQKINAALRAAHSIKGGAGMMSYQLLSQQAHLLEDSFKVLKTQSQSLEVDASLENLLLSAVNCLRTVIQHHQHDRPIDSAWIDQQAEPIFQHLHDRLGDPPDEDAVSVLSTDSGQDVVALLFETEVEGCLERLEAVLANPAQPCLQEELSILAQELGGLGEMLQLEPFSQLCNAVEQVAVIATPDLIESIARSALKAWRRSQALVLSGQLDLLSSVLDDDLMAMPAADVEKADVEKADVKADVETEADVEMPATAAEWQDEPVMVTSELIDIDPVPEAVVANLEEFSEPEVHVVAPMAGPLPAASSEDWQAATSTEPTPVETTQTDDFKFEVKSDAEPTFSEEDQNATVRISVRQLNQLNDLFGELTIERNGLDLFLKRLRGLARLLIQRVRLLEQSNADVRIAYDRLIPRSIDSSLPLLADHRELLPYSPAHSSTFDILELDQYSELHLLSQQVMEIITQVQEVSNDIDLSLDETEQTARELNKRAKQLQTNLNQIRMRPLSDIVDRFPRALREWCLQYGKQAKLTIKGGNTLIERSILEALNDPLMHLIRNAFDHGIEPPEIRRDQDKPAEGTIEIHATHHGNRTLITISDDGRGIPLHKIRMKAEQMGLDPSLLATASEEDLLSLIFEPGFSTSDRVTDLSGRGVGLDVVRDSLRQIRGDIRVTTRAGMGTTFTLSVPFTLSVVRVLLAESHGMLLAFPSDSIKETVLLASMTSEDSETLVWQNQPIQRVDPSRWFQFNCPRQPNTLEAPPTIDAPTALITPQGTDLVAIQVDRTWGEQEVAIRRPVGKLAMPEGFAGCAIVADGRVVPLVNVTEMLDWVISCQRDSNRQAGFPPLVLPPKLLNLGRTDADLSSATAQSTVLIVDDSINIRRFLALTLEKGGFRVEQAKDGLDALDKLQRGISVQAVICDIEMPRLDGFGFLAKSKALPAFEQIPVVMLTSRSGEKHRQLAMNLGASAYFSKPYNEQELLQTIEQIIN